MFLAFTGLALQAVHALESVMTVTDVRYSVRILKEVLVMLVQMHKFSRQEGRLRKSHPVGLSQAARNPACSQ